MRTLRLCLPLSALTVIFLAGCSSSNEPYALHSTPEKIEWNGDSLDVYPNDVRQDPARYGDQRVAWAGIIRSSDAEEFGDGLMKIHSVFEHRYFDWEQDQINGKLRYGLSPRGEGLFETDWVVRKIDPDADAQKAEAFGAPGKMAIVYGVPDKVDSDGVVHLQYRFVQIVDKKNYDTHVFDYGRFGEPVTYLK